MERVIGVAARLAVIVGLAAALSAPADARFVTFESGQVRPLALSPDGTRLFAINTPDGQLEVFDVDATGALQHVASVPVGLEPVAVAARTDDEVWVVNHLSDSVSIVDVGASPPRTVRTLLVGDEPRDIVFAGPKQGGFFTRAFVTTARRGQNLPPSVPPLLTTPGVGRALVFVFDATSLGASLGGSPLAILELFGDTPRSLAATPDGAAVYAAVFQSGNRTTTVGEGVLCDGGASAPPCGGDGVVSPGGLPGGLLPGGLPPPRTNFEGVTQPEVGLIVRFDAASGEWRDGLGRNWSNGVRFHLPDLDVFEIDALASTPAEVRSFAGVGTVLFGMLVNPANGHVYVANTEARNEVRFEGPGIFGGSTVRGHLQEARITVIDGDDVRPRHLNKHITALPDGYATAPMPAAVKDQSLATPVAMALSSDGRLYVAAFGSDEIGVLDAAAVESDTFVPNAADHIGLSGGGPSGLVLDEARDRLYVLTRFDDAVKVVDLATRAEIAAHPLHNPEPPQVLAGRRFLYDARFTSSNGEASCSSCHVFADFDSLAWDLGNPDGVVMPNPNPFPVIGGSGEFHPMKGPMTTQTLRGLAHHGPMHWRGDRTGGNAEPPGDPLDESLAFQAFNVAFDGLLGRDEGEIPDADMKAFTDFILEVTLPPNPVRALDNSRTPSQKAGRDFFSGPASDIVTNCNGCHRLDPSQGFFGTDGGSSFENETQEFKVPHLRNAYQKVGMFGMPRGPFASIPSGAFTGDQVRGFGFLHDGSFDTVFDFLHANVFGFPGGDAQRRQVEDFVLAFDSTLAPIVGQQATLSATDLAVAGPRIDLMKQRAAIAFDLVDVPGARECDLVVKGVVGGEARGWVYRPEVDGYRSDRSAEPLATEGALRALAAGGATLTYTCAPPGSGSRMGVDRDDDGFFDRDEIDQGSDPADPRSFPGGLVRTDELRIDDDDTFLVSLHDPRLSFRSAPAVGGAAELEAPPFGSAGDPTAAGDAGGGATLTIFNAAGGGDQVVLPLAAERWHRSGSPAEPRYSYRDARRLFGPIGSIAVRDGKLSIHGQGPGLYELGGSPQGAVALRLRLGSGAVWCAVASAREPPARNDNRLRFRSAPQPAMPSGCPSPPLP